MNHIVTIGKSILKEVYKKRDPWARKYDYGHLLVIGGSKLYTGSPILSAMAALRTGVDVVTIITVERAADVAAQYSPNLITYPLKGNFLSMAHLQELLNFTKNKNAITIGGGLWRQATVMDTVVAFLKRTDKPVVIDADAIHAVSGEKDVLQNKPFVVTPNEREFAVLSGKEPTKNVEERIVMVKETAVQLKTTILLKGHISIVSDGERVAISKFGSPFLTKGGTGDTLTGICGSLIAQGNDIFTSACAAAYINGMAGSIAAKELRQAVLATDLIEAIPKVIKA
jgi:NAD(P)H-hydrate epimerase